MKRKLFDTSLIIIITFLIIYPDRIFSQNPENVKKTTEELSMAKYYGRSIAMSGDKKAADWIASEYTKTGLKKWGPDYFQPFTTSGNTFTGKVEVSIDGKIMKPADDYYLRLSCPDTSATFEIVKFYDGSFNHENAKKLVETDLKDKVLVVDFDQVMELYQKPDSILGKVFKKDIGGVIFLSAHTIRWYNIYGNRIIHKVMIDMNKSSFDPSSSKLHVEVKAEFQKDYKTQNIIGYIGGKSKKDEYVVICGHYDHIGMMGTNTVFPGADDNASAIGIMLELANYYSIPANSPQYTLIFAAFSAEETGLNGSAWFVKNCPVDTAKIKMVLNFDMVAFGKDSFIVFNGTESPEIMKMLNNTVEKQELPFVYKPRENIPMSDHYSFTEKGIPAVFITSGTDPSPDYHTNKDDYKSASFNNIKELMLSIIEFVKAV